MEKVSVVLPQEYMLEVHKELSKSYREGTAQKLKFMAQPYKMKGLKKMLQSKMTVLGVHKDMSNSYTEGIDKKLESMAQPYKTKVLKKWHIIVFWVHKGLSSYSYREGIDEKLKSLAQPYKTKVLKKNW